MARVDLLKVLYSKHRTALEFKFETLVCRPMMSLLTFEDIYNLNQIITSNRLSSKPKEKYKLIDNILQPRGFKRLASGTNRVVYKYLDDYSFVLKVALDKVGLSDNPNEYYNQFLLKPFVTKCFEVSPCGTVGLFERVEPITSREEYLLIAEDVFDMLNRLIGKYILEDVGTKYFMNIGIRSGFGVVLLDYPYLYELDGNKLYCNKPDPNNYTGYCGGLIDYDNGFNNLVCEKCGKMYLATELKKYKENNNIIMKGDNAMKLSIVKGKGKDKKVIAKLNTNDQNSDHIKSKEEFNNENKYKISVTNKLNNEDYNPSYKDLLNRSESKLKVSINDPKFRVIEEQEPIKVKENFVQKLNEINEEKGYMEINNIEDKDIVKNISDINSIINSYQDKYMDNIQNSNQEVDKIYSIDEESKDNTQKEVLEKDDKISVRERLVISKRTEPIPEYESEEDINEGSDSIIDSY